MGKNYTVILLTLANGVISLYIYIYIYIQEEPHTRWLGDTLGGWGTGRSTAAGPGSNLKKNHLPMTTKNYTRILLTMAKGQEIISSRSGSY